MGLFIKILFVIFFSPCLAFATPSVTNVTGTASHGESLVIYGSGFLTKSPAAPLWWDDGEGASDDYTPGVSGDYGWVTSSLPTNYKHYTDVSPTHVTQDSGIRNLHYRAPPYRNVAAPHPFSNRILVGGYDDENSCTGPDASRQNVGVVVSGDGEIYSTWYINYKHTIDPLWPTGYSGEAQNYKHLVFETGTNSADGFGRPTMYSSINYLSFAGDCDTCCDGGQGRIHPLHADTWYGALGAMQILDTTCDDQCWETGNTFNNIPSFRGGSWRTKEVLLDETNNFLQLKWDNVTAYDSDLDGNCTFNTNVEGGPRGITIEGFWKGCDCSSYPTCGTPGVGGDWRHDDAWKYIDDIYVDNTFSRIMICNNATYTSATICEPQIPSAWATGEITATVNQGALTGTAYLFVFDSTNTANSTGYEVTFGEESSSVSVSNIVLSNGNIQ